MISTAFLGGANASATAVNTNGELITVGNFFFLQSAGADNLA